MTAGLRERGKARRRRQILDAARALIRADPAKEPTVSAIAAAAEVSQATVFNLVGPREQILAALADDALAEARERISEHTEAGGRDGARGIVTAILDDLLADAAVHRHVLAHWTESARLLRESPAQELHACLQAARDRGEIGPDADEHALVVLITTTCTGAMHQWAAGVIDERRLRARCLASVDVVFAAAGAGDARAAAIAALGDLT